MLYKCDCNVSSYENEDINIKGDSEIVIIQGDTYRREINLDIDRELVKGLYFSCADLNICRECYYEDEAYILEFQPYETESLDKYTGTYDLTLELLDNSILTLCLNKSLIILSKKNKIDNPVIPPKIWDGKYREEE